MADDFAAAMNQATTGWVKEMGLELQTATVDEVVATWQVGERHLQNYGIVHGGVHCGVIETLASVGAALVARPRGQRVVGLENNTSFIRAVRAGARLTATARPLTRGRTSQVWEGVIRDEAGQLVAQGRVRLLCVAEERSLGEGGRG